MATGSGIAAVALSAMGIVRLLFYLFPAWDLGPIPWWMGMVMMPELIFAAGVVALWRKRKPVAIGILLLAITLVTHFGIHAASQGGRR